MRNEERLAEIIRLRKQGMNNTQIGRALGIQRSTVIRTINRANVKLPPPQQSPTNSIAIEEGDDELHLNAKGRVQSLEDLLEQANVDTTEWRVTKWVANKWESLGKEGTTVPLWQVNAWLQR